MKQTRHRRLKVQKIHGKRRDWWTDRLDTLACAAMHAGQKGCSRNSRSGRAQHLSPRRYVSVFFYHSDPANFKIPFTEDQLRNLQQIKSLLRTLPTSFVCGLGLAL